MTENAHEHVMAPISVGPMRLANRVVFAAHGTGHGMNGIGDDLIAYHEARARGGVGLTVLEGTCVHESSVGPTTLRSFDESIVGAYERFLERMIPYSTRFVQQLWHGGRHGATVDGGPPWAPSALPAVDSGAMPIAMTQTQIDELVEAHGRAATYARRGGLAGVEVHAAHGYLLNQFLSPASNRREDEYGGSLENRLRFPLEVVAAVRAAVGDGLVVGVRFNGDDGVEGGLTVDDMVEIARAFEATGLLDYVSLSLGNRWHEDRLIAPMHAPHGYELPTTATVARALSLPTIVTGRILSLDEADRVVASGEATLASMVRALIADPELVAKSTQGEPGRVRPCIGCNHGCAPGTRESPPAIGCAVNPFAGRERHRHSAAAPYPKRVFIAGGGPAGLEAARSAAVRGHRVTLYDAAAELGGQLALARRAPHRHDIGAIVDWLHEECRRLGVHIHTATNLDRATIDQEQPDTVILATGSLPRRDGIQAARPIPILGHDHEHVRTSWDIINGTAPTPTTAVVLDDTGHYEAIAVVDTLINTGATVHYVTRHDTLGRLIDRSNSVADAQRRFARAGVTTHPRSTLDSVADHTATIHSLDTDTTHTIDADTAILVLANHPNNQLAQQLADWPGTIHTIGDAIAPRYLHRAIHEAHAAAAALGD